MKIKSSKISELIVGHIYSLLGLGNGDVIEGTYKGCNEHTHYLFFEVKGIETTVMLGTSDWDKPKNFVCHSPDGNMKLIFDEKEVRSYGDIDDPKNTPDKLVDRLKAKLTKIGDFMNADSVKYVEGHKNELLVIIRGNQKLTLLAHGNAADGGYITVE